MAASRGERLNQKSKGRDWVSLWEAFSWQDEKLTERERLASKDIHFLLVMFSYLNKSRAAEETSCWHICWGDSCETLHYTWGECEQMSVLPECGSEVTYKSRDDSKTAVTLPKPQCDSSPQLKT